LESARRLRDQKMFRKDLSKQTGGKGEKEKEKEKQTRGIYLELLARGRKKKSLPR